MNQSLVARPLVAARRVTNTLLALAVVPTVVHAQAGASTQLARVQSVATNGNHFLRALKARHATALARAAAAGYGLPASLDVDVEEVPGVVNLQDAGSIRIGLRRELRPGGVASSERALAAVEADDAMRAIGAGERWVAAQVEIALLTTAGERRIANRLAAEDTVLAMADEALRVRFATGSARYIDVLRIRTERLRVQSDKLAAATQARLARQRLNALLGSAPPDASVVALLDSAVTHFEARIGDSLPALPSLDSLVRLAPALGRADVGVRRAEATLALARAGQRPALAAGVGLQRFVRDAGRHTVGPTLGLSVSLPFITGSGRRLAIEAAVLAVDHAVANRSAVVASVRAELVARTEAYLAHREQLRLHESAALRGARDEREAALAAYRSGELPLIELLDFERALRQAEVALLRARLDVASMYVRALTAIDDNPEVGAFDQ